MWPSYNKDSILREQWFHCALSYFETRISIDIYCNCASFYICIEYHFRRTTMSGATSSESDAARELI
jgi:hypothetical protein